MEQSNNTTIYSAAENYTEIVELLKKYRGLVCSIARKYLFHCYTEDELISIGNEGLIEAKGKFDASIGMPFKTFAYRYIENAIKNAINSISNISANNTAVLREINAYVSSYYQDNGEEPSLEEIKDFLNAKNGDRKFTVSEIATILENKYCDSLDRELDDDNCLFDLVADVSENPIENYSKIEFNDYVNSMTKILDKTEYFVITSKFGLFNSAKLDDKEIASILNINVSEVKKIYESSMNKIQKSFKKLSINL